MPTTTGHGSTLAFATSTALNSEELVDFTAPAPQGGDPVDTSHLGTTVATTKQARDLIDWGPATAVYHWDPTIDWGAFVNLANENITYTDPSSDTWVWSGYISNAEPGEMTVNGDSLVVVNVTIQVSGDVTVTDVP